MAVEVPYEFLNFLNSEQAGAVDVSLDDKRARALEFYMGEPFGDEVEGRSQAVTRDVSEVVDFLTVGILGTVMASGKVVEFESEPEPAQNDQQEPGGGQSGAGGQILPGLPGGAPAAPQMVNYGEQATAAIQYQFMRKQKGYRILHDVLKAGLLEMSGIVKTYPEPQPDLHQRHVALADEIEQTDDGPKYQGKTVVQAEAADEGWQPGTPSMTWHVTVAHPQPPVFCDRPVPNEYFRVSPDAIDLDEAAYVGERLPKTMSDLIKLGYAREDLEPVWSDAPADTVVSQARDSERSRTRQSIGQREGPEKTLWLDEEYPLYDLDGDGIAERLFVHRIGNVVLKVMPVDEQPYSLWSPFPMQHRLIGQSVADKTMDIQRIRSVLLRQGLDSQYIANAPRTLVDESSITIDTIDDLLTVRPGALIRYRGNAPQPLVQNDTSALAFQGMEMMSAERESRTGITRQSQGLNPDTTNKTASGMAMLQSNAQQIELYITRNFAEFIVGPMFAKRYRLMRRYGQPFRMKVQGDYVTIDPAQWPDEMDMTINVGLGTGNKDQKLQYRMSLLGIQQQIMAAGSRIVGEEQVYQNVKALVEDSGLGAPTNYVIDPATLPPQEPQPHPDAIKAQGEAMLAQQKEQNAHEQAMTHLSINQEVARNEAQIKAQSAALDLQTKRETAGQQAQLADAKAAKEAQLADDKQAFEQDLSERRFSFDQEMAKKKHDAMVAAAATSLPANRPGGSLAE